MWRAMSGACYVRSRSARTLGKGVEDVPMTTKRVWVTTLAAAGFAIAASACSAPAEDDSGDDPGDNGGNAPGGAGSSAAAGGSGAVDPGTGSGTGSGAGTGGGSQPAAGGSGSGTTAGSAAPPDVPAGPPPPVPEELDPNVDWTALTLVYPNAYTAFDGMHSFQVPFYVDGTTVELAGWSAIPSDAVTFDADPELGGVIVTIVKHVPQIVIAARVDDIGGTAALNVTMATPEQWTAGEARYNNGIDFELPMIDPAAFAELLLDPNWMPPKPPGDIACNNCHSTGAKYFEVQHTPTQAARFTDDQLRTILTMGMKPAGVGFRVLPEMLLGMTATDLYAEFHTWDSTEEEITGLIVYLRSLTPQGQGDILLPDGTYVEPGTMPML
jgi:hypothetical protein